MNRIQLSPAEPQASFQQVSKHTAHVEQAVISQSHRGVVPHMLFAPMHYEKNYAYPLVVWLHGHGGHERQLQRVMPEVSMRNYVAIAPRGSVPRDGGFDWGDSCEQVAAAEHAVFECIDAAMDRLNIAEHRIFLGGYESGGTMAFRIGLKHPQQFAGILSIGGPFPMGRMPLLRLSQSRTLPLFIAQGRESVAYPLERTCEELRLFHVAGLCVTLRQYPCGDELNTQMLRDMDAWLMEQVTGVAASEDESQESFGDSN